MADQLIPGDWRVPRWIKFLGIAIGVIAIFALVMFLTGNGDLLEKLVLTIWNGLKSIWLWIVGFAGGILALFQGKKRKPGINEVKKEIETENERIGLELRGLRDSMTQVDEWRERERKLHQREVDLLERELALKEQQLSMLEQSINELSTMSGKEFVESLSEEKKEEIKKSVDDSRIDL